MAHAALVGSLTIALLALQVQAAKPIPPIVVPCVGSGEVGYASEENIPAIKFDDGLHVVFFDYNRDTAAHGVHMASMSDGPKTYTRFAFEGNVDYKMGEDFCHIRPVPWIYPEPGL